MAVTTSRPTTLAYQDESTFGTDPGSWGANGLAVDHIEGSIAFGSITQTMVADDRHVSDLRGKHAKLLGLTNVSVAFQVPFVGTGVTTAATSQVSQTRLGDLLQQALGGQTRSYSSAISGSPTASIIAPTTTTGYDEGVGIAVRQASTGRIFASRVASWDGTSATLERTLPFTPVAGTDTVEGVQDSYPDSSVIEDTGTSTAWHLQVGGPGSSDMESFVLVGCRLELSGITLERGARPVLSFTIHGFIGTLPDDVADVTSFTNSAPGLAPAVVGMDGDCWYQDDGTAANVTVGVSTIEVVPAVPVTMQEGVTVAAAKTPGCLGWSSTNGEARMTITVIAPATGNLDDFQASTLKQTVWSNLGTRGKGIAIAAYRMQIDETPTSFPVGPVIGQKLSHQCLMDSTNAAAGNARLWEADFHIYQF